MKRRPGRRAPVPYMDAREFLRHRRDFLSLLGKGALGAGVLGLAACDSGSGEGGDSFQLMGALPPPDAADAVPDVPTFDSSGALPDLKDVTPGETGWVTDGIPSNPPELPDLKDVQSWEGPAGVPPLPDTVQLETLQKDTCTPGDAEGEFPPLAGVPVMPDTLQPSDVVETQDTEGEFPPLAGGIPMPQDVDTGR
ncbi:MAG: hypothetical protein FJ098_03670 [Deltaproteobacteria bacterium]|nr:hypothetical protein [Deltaproteobacteria bacterium]